MICLQQDESVRGQWNQRCGTPHTVLFLWRCPKLNIEIPSTWMSRQLVLTHAWIIKNWNGIISKTRDKGLLLDYCTSGAGLPFYAIASSDSSRFNRELPHYASFTAYNIDHRTIALERVWWFQRGNTNCICEMYRSNEWLRIFKRSLCNR